MTEKVKFSFFALSIKELDMKIFWSIILSLVLVASVQAGPPTYGGGGAAAGVSDDAYDATAWNGVTGSAPSKNAVRDKIETLGGGGDITTVGECATGDCTDDFINGTDIADEAIDSEHYADESIDNEHLADNAVDSDELAAGSVDNAHLAIDIITIDEMGDSDHGDFSYSGGDATLDANVVDSAEIADDAVEASELATDSVTNDAIDNDGNFTFTGTIDMSAATTSLGAISSVNYIDSDMYVDGSIDNEHLNWADIDYLDDEGKSSKTFLDGSPASDDTYTAMGVIEGLNAGENVAQWETVYFDATDSEWKQADADAAGEFPAWGIAVAAGTDGNEMLVLTKGIVRNDGWDWSAPNVPLYLSDTAGGLTETAPSTSGDCVQPVGYTISDDEVYFDVNPVSGWGEVE
jgi:hypothetical protein